MRTFLLTLFVFVCVNISKSQVDFQTAYAQNPFVPQGLLEAVAWTNTRMVHLDQSLQSCSGMPRAYGIMGLHDNGEGYFIENGVTVAQLSGISVQDQKNDAQMQVNAYAAAFNTLMSQRVPSPVNADDPSTIRKILLQLTEIPASGLGNLLARDMQVYEILRFLRSPEHAQQYGFLVRHYDLEDVFGEANYSVLSGSKVIFTTTGIQSAEGHSYSPAENKSSDYGPAIWNPAAPCNFSSRQGVAISAITIHTVQGTYAGCISWFQNCAASVSAHYVIRSSDGQVTQMVQEADKAWHVGSENPYTIGYEHEGYVNNPSWYTEAMYQSSADLSKDIVNSGYGINPLRTFDGPASSGTNVLGNCIKIKGHQHYPNQTHVDPGINWNWEHYYQLINDPPSIITITASSGTLYDTGGPAGNYPDDERQLWLIQPPGAQSITLNFTSFNLENNWDYLYLYDGDTLTSPLIGIYTGTTSPGTVISSTGSLLMEFRSDCSTVAPGWEASYIETVSDATPPLTSILNGSMWYNDDFIVGFVDTDAQSGVSDRFYLTAKMAQTNNDWQSIPGYGFGHETFEDGSANWTSQTGTYTVSTGAYAFNDVLEQNSNAYMALSQNNTCSYLYEWDQRILSSSTNQRAGMHFFCDDPALPNRGNSYFVYLRENDDKVQIYSVDNDVFTLQADIPLTIDQGQTYNVKTIYNPLDGVIRVFVDNAFVGEWQDLTPLSSGGYISLRTGGCEAEFDNIRVYQSRSTQALLTAGFADMLDIESEAATASALVRSMALDSAGNWSLPVTEPFLLDFTPPSIDFLYDGSFNYDIDTFQTATIEANWDAIDIHSDLSHFEVAIGNLPNLDNVYPWTNSGPSEAFSYVLGSPVYNEVYYISIRAYNNAGLYEQFMSDGQRYINNVGLSPTVLEQTEIYPNPASSFIHIRSEATSLYYELYDASGRICLYGDTEGKVDISHLAEGTYDLVLRSGGMFVVKRVVVKR